MLHLSKLNLSICYSSLQLQLVTFVSFTSELNCIKIYLFLNIW